MRREVIDRDSIASAPVRMLVRRAGDVLLPDLAERMRATRENDIYLPGFRLPDAVQAQLHRDAWRRPPLFDWLERNGSIDPDEMHRVFNCGIGMVVIVPKSEAAAVVAGPRIGAG